ncbi:hypothetical protein NLJ89_g6213 [Agrocybe chaxingu]|uniref:Fungal-type protein kinase domain-containing protein n=1 Tax=Agrocybe chaxingu TaxID=84603 RepID=A0A9W8JZ34_9AGAR|nr:hypothetical protein NLJ89_g6213 [Agrocybe chaxingu]
MSVVHQELEVELWGHGYAPVSVSDFVKNIWGLEASTLGTSLNTQCGLQEDALKQYENVYLNATSESAPHQPFHEIPATLPQDIYTTLEFDYATCSTLPIAATRSQYTTGLMSFVQSHSTTVNSSTSTKRPISQVDGANGSSKSKRARVLVRGDELEPTSNELDCLGDSRCHFTTGITIDGTTVALGRCGRSAIIRTVGFDSRSVADRGPQLLAASLFAFSRASMKQAGFDPFVRPFVNTTGRQLVLDSGIVMLDRLKLESWAPEMRKKEEEPVRDRVVNFLVSRPCHSIADASSIEEVQTILLDCLESHYHAYTTSGVLHYDISESNILLVYLEEFGKPVCGILSDFDLASEEDDKVFIPRTKTHYRKSTQSFTAKDLLIPPRKSTAPPLHYYRHDLESFFYFLICACTQYTFNTDSQGSRRVPTPPCLQLWNDQETAYMAKAAFYTDHGLEIVGDAILPHFAGVWNEWVTPLYRKVFKPAVALRPSRCDPGSKEYDSVTCNGMVTFEKFMAAIGVQPRPAKSLASRLE